MDRLINDFQVSCKNCNLDKICLPRGLSKNEIDDLSIVVRTNSVLQKGESIYRQGDDFKSIVAIKSGSAKLVTNDGQGNEHILNVLLPGELIGFDGMYKNHYTCSAIALEVISYCELPVSHFDELCQKIPGINRELFKHSSETINTIHSQVVCSNYTAEEKLAKFLINLSDRLKARGFSADEFNLPLTRQEMGEHLGMTLETVSRMLKSFQEKGMICVDRKYIQIKDQQSLRNIFNDSNSE